MIVVDASVSLKWFFVEAGAAAALELFDRYPARMVMPELFMVEVLSGLVRAANMDQVKLETVREQIADFLASQRSGVFAIRSAAPTFARASDIAMELRHPLKDCIYLAFAESLDCALVTADARFYDKAVPKFPFVELLPL